MNPPLNLRVGRFLFRRCILSAFCFGFLFSGEANAAIIAYDGFEGYTAGSQIESSSGAGLNGGTGFTGAYNVSDGERNAAVVSTTSLTYDALDIDGGSNALRIGGRDMASAVDSFLARAFASQTGTLYLSFLLQGTQLTEDEDFLQVGLSNQLGEPPASMGIAGSSGALPMEFFIRAPGGTGSQTTLGSPDFTLTNTYLIVLKVSKVSGSTTYNRVDFFLNPTSLIEPASPTLFRTSDTGLGDISNFRIRVARLESTDNYYFDEFRIATTFAEVVPEPSSALLLMTSICSLILRRRRS